MDEKKIRKSLSGFYEELLKTCRESGRKTQEIEVIFATKYIKASQLASFIKIYDEMFGKKVSVGENRVQDAERKFSQLEDRDPLIGDKYRGVMIGNLQKNKINKALLVFDELHAIDSVKLAEEVEKRADRIIPVYFEVNVSGEKSKQGISAEESKEAIEAVRKMKKLSLKGLMTMAPYAADPETVRPYFRKLRNLADEYRLKTSMGMSGDFRQAIEEGSDVLRIGTRIFG